MRKLLKIIFALLFASIFIFLGYEIISKITHKKEIQQKIKTIPKFSFLNINGEDFTNSNLKKYTPVIFIYFNTDCDYCNEEAKMLSQNIKKFRDVQIIFVSFENPNRIKKFAQQYKLNNYDNIHFLHDSKVTFASTFDVNSLPCFVLYDKNQKLIEKIKGQTKPEFLIKKLNGE